MCSALYFEVNFSAEDTVVHPNMKNLLSLNHPHVIPNLQGFIFSGEHVTYFEEFPSGLYCSTTVHNNIGFKGIVHFEVNFWCVLAYLGLPRCRCLCFVKPVVSVSHIMEVYGHHLKEHAQRSPN